MKINYVFGKEKLQERSLGLYFKKQQDNTYRIIANNELEELYPDANIIKEIEPRRLQWTGHLKRHSEERTVRLLWVEVSTQRRPRGRSRLRWRENTTGDLKARGVENWMEIAQDREEWRYVVESVKTEEWLYRHGVKNLLSYFE
uniref:Uncharacterized protein LOC114330299 n=1 Tax=Diabrotica virgifera virgifera TaxID=50390 RepID=A0A6P7FK78_DIAVI